MLALITIIVLLVGIPVALLGLGGNPLGGTFPSWDDVTSALTQPDDGSLFLGALVVIAWLGWASFALGLLIEIPSALRGRSAPRIPVLRIQQRAAAGLVAAVAGLFVVGPVGMATAAETNVAHIVPQEPDVSIQAAAAAQTVLPPVESTPEVPSEQPPADERATQPRPATETTPAVEAKPATEEAAKQRTHVVQRGDSLWKIAERQLGDGARWPEIAELNYGVRQSDGGKLDSTHWIAPGWRLLLPAEPPAASPTVKTAAVESAKHVVVEGDTLWDIAEQRLGEGQRYPELFEASRGTIQPDGRRLTDPDLIYPGWQITVPGAESPSGHQKPAADEKPPVQDKPAPEPPVQEPPAQEVEPPVEEQPPVENEQPPVEEQPPAEEERPAAEESETQAIDEAAESFPVRTTAGVGALVAAGFLAFLAARRRAQQRHRQPGERIAMPVGAVAAAETELRGVADPMSVELVDLGLRGLALSCSRHDMPLPPVRLARLTSEQLELYLTEGAELPAPFVATDESHVWFLPASAARELDVAELHDVPAPYPSLVTIGHGPEDGHLLLDLERLGTLALVGEPQRTEEVVAALAVELATSPWADDLQVTLVGTCPELASGLETGRIRHLPSVGTLLDELVRRAEQDRAVLAESGARSLDDARAKGVAAATWTPEIVVLGEALTHEQTEQLADLVEPMPRVAVAAVTSGDDAIGEWSVELNPSNPDEATLQPIGIEIKPQRLDERQYTQILELLGITEQPPSSRWTGEIHEQSVSDLPIVAETDRDDEISGDDEVDAAAFFDDALASRGRETHVFRSDETPPVPGSLAAELDNEELATPPPYVAAANHDDHAAHAPVTGYGAEHDEDDQQPDVLRSLEAEFAEFGARGADEPEVVHAPFPASAGHRDEEDVSEPTSPGGPTILLLGPVEVEDAEGPVEQSKYRQLTEIAAYIALHPGLDHSALDEAIWPGNRVTQNTRNTAISKLRRWFGRDEHGEDYLPRVDSGYRFHPGVTTDWDRWIAGVGEDPRSANTEVLAASLELVRGQPFTGVNPRRYAWAEHLKQEMISAIVDAAHELAQRALKSGDAHLARKASTIGLQVEPGMELLWRDRIKAEHVAGNRAGIEEAVARLTAISNDLGDDLEDATVRLIQELLPAQAGAHRSGVQLSGRY